MNDHPEGVAANDYPEGVLVVSPRAAEDARFKDSALAGFSFLFAADAAEALDRLQTGETVGAVLAVMRLPDMAGLELLSRLRERWPAIRRILIAGETDREQAFAAFAQGGIFQVLSPRMAPGALASLLRHAIKDYRFATGSLQPGRRDVTPRSAERTPQFLLGMLNHELRTPLNHILGFSSLLEQRCKQRGDLEPLEYLAYIRESGQTLLRNVNRILEITRLMSQDFKPEAELVDLTALIRAEVARLSPFARERGVALAVDSPDESVLTLAGETDITSAVCELIHNAVKFNHPGGHVAIALTAGAGEVALRIADTGIGMAGADINRMRHALHSGAEAKDRRFHGAGVGLTLASLTAQVYGGALEIESRKNHGTAVVMRLRRAAAIAPAVKIA